MLPAGLLLSILGFGSLGQSNLGGCLALVGFPIGFGLRLFFFELFAVLVGLLLCFLWGLVAWSRDAMGRFRLGLLSLLPKFTHTATGRPGVFCNTAIESANADKVGWLVITPLRLHELLLVWQDIAVIKQLQKQASHVEALRKIFEESL